VSRSINATEQAAFWEYRVSLFEWQICRDDQRFLLVAAAHDLEEQISGMGIVGQVADLVDRQQAGPEICAEASLKRPRRALTGEIEDQIGGREQARRMAGEDRLVAEILGENGFAEAVWREAQALAKLSVQVLSRVSG
jgi:hypothetical protein